jgi:hypothetical protein
MVPRAIARTLREAGHDVDAVVEHSALRGLADAQQLAHAADAGRVFVTYDTGDYLTLASQRVAAGQEHAGVVLLGSARFPQGTVEAVVQSLGALLDGPPQPTSFTHWLQ